MLAALQEEDILIITADHGCDPTTVSTDHSREYTPLLAFGKAVKPGTALGTRSTFGDIGATVAEWLGIAADLEGASFLAELGGGL
jgi:phosphopentomutase